MLYLHRFDPERFRDKSNIPPYAFEPFNTGKRKCPGYRMVDIESQTFIVTILKQFKVRVL